MACRGRPPKAVERPVATVVGGPPDKPLTVSTDAVASAAWDEVVAMIGQSLTRGDGAILTAYATTYALLIHARRALAPPEPAYVDAATGKPLRGKKLAQAKAAHAAQPWHLTTTAGTGAVKLHPLLAQINGASRDLARYASELGLTPAARARAGVAAPEPADALDAFLAGA